MWFDTIDDVLRTLFLTRGRIICCQNERRLAFKSEVQEQSLAARQEKMAFRHSTFHPRFVWSQGWSTIGHHLVSLNYFKLLLKKKLFYWNFPRLSDMKNMILNVYKPDLLEYWEKLFQYLFIKNLLYKSTLGLFWSKFLFMKYLRAKISPNLISRIRFKRS